MRPAVDYQQATIADGQSLSAGVNLQTKTLTGVIVASTWNTAALTFQGSYDGTNYFNLFNGASELSYAAIAASTWVLVDPTLFYGLPYIKVRSGTAGSAVAQTGDTIVTLISRPL